MKNAHPQTTEASALDKFHSNSAFDLFLKTLPPVTPASLPRHKTREHEVLLALVISPANQADYTDGWRFSAYIKSFDHGWVIINGTKFCWQSDGSVSLAITSGAFTLDQSNITYICEEGGDQ